MERVHDDYRSYQVQGDCYKYIHRCPNCGKDIYLQSLDVDYDFEEKKEGD